jgi:hypothetical protein
MPTTAENIEVAVAEFRQLLVQLVETTGDTTRIPSLAITRMATLATGKPSTMAFDIDWPSGKSQTHENRSNSVERRDAALRLSRALR